MCHLTPEEIEDVVYLKAGISELDPLKEHLLVCKECQDKVLAHDGYSETMRRALIELLVQRDLKSWKSASLVEDDGYQG